VTSPTTDRLADFTTRPRVVLLSAMAAVIGVIGAFVAFGLERLIRFFTNLAYFQRASLDLVSPAENHLGWWAVLVPVAGGLIIGLMARYGSERIRGHGIPEALEAILIGRSRMTVKVAILKPLSSALSIGTGGPFGAEGPIIMTGGACGSLFAQAFHLTAAERKTLLVAGAASGMAGIFATPLAAVLLAVELLLFEWKPRSFVPVATASAVAAALRVPLLGPGPLFPVAAHALLPWHTLPLALILGILAGLGSALLTSLVYGCEDLFLKLPFHWMWWPMLGGLAVGLGGMFFPRALGVGYDTIGTLLTGHFVGRSVLGLLVTKAVIWSVALGSGTSGGVLAPLLMMGGALGSLASSVAHIPDPGLWATLGMGAMMGGTMRSPLTAIAFMLELTDDINVLPALLISCVAAHLVTVLLMKRSILTEKVARRGHHVIREYQAPPLHQLRVADVMDANVATVPASLPLEGLFSRLVQEDPVMASQHAWPVVDDAGRLAAVITRGDMVRAMERDDFEQCTAADVGTHSVAVAYPDELLEEAAMRMLDRDIGGLPVVARDDPHRLLGFLARKGILTGWFRVADEERRREPGWLSDGILRRVRARIK